MTKLLGRTAGELLQSKFDPRTPICGKWLTEQSLTIVHAWRGVGKTFFALFLAWCIAATQAFFKWPVPRRRRVIYFDGEMGPATMQERLIALMRGSNADTEENLIRFVSYSDCAHTIMWNLATHEGQALYAEHMANYDVAIFDNLSTCFRYGREGEVEAWNRVQPWLIKQRDAYKAIILIHHSGKALTQRGASQKEDVVDNVINLRAATSQAQGAEFEIHFEKKRNLHGHEVSPILARLEQGDRLLTWSYRELDDAIEHKIRELADYCSPSEIAAALNVPTEKVLRIVRKR